MPELLTPAEIRDVQIGVLLDLDAWCRRHDVVYYLTYGTLLGAARHGGFVPWDDDVDVMVPRAGYDRLVAELGRPGDDAPAYLSVASTELRDDWPLPFVKLCDDRTDLVEVLHDPLPMGVNIDVFPLDEVPAGPVSRWVQARVLDLLRPAIALHYVDPVRGRDYHSRLALRLAKPLLRLLPARVLVRVCDRVARLGDRRPSGRVGVRIGSYDWSVPQAWLGTPVEIEFEGHRLCGPAAPDDVLRVLYGEWRTPPPAAEQVNPHAFTATRLDAGDPRSPG